ncbi:helix-turn-helix domain-containing protein [Kitasatospora nipponensis]|uniref:Helix-turn-helix domain-containing protein n=1 Tax=Kitasatospora nipponensis TaxID=258049 RepID=A0ABP4DVI5_9ACTN
MEQDHLLGEPTVPQIGANSLPEQRAPLSVPYRSAGAQPGPGGERRAGGPRLRVDARRNLESVLRAAREVFGELGYDAPMEEVARRAGVGVGTVYRRFPSKEVLVQRIAAEEVAWLTARAREALYGPAGPWEALAAYLATAVGTGAGRLLPPEAFGYAEELARVPEQRLPTDAGPAAQGGYGGRSGPQDGTGLLDAAFAGAIGAAAEASFGADLGAGLGAPPEPGPAEVPDADPRLLLQLLAALVARAAAAGELRPGVTVSEIVLVLTAAVPPSIGRGGVRGAAEPAERLLRILLDGLRTR